MGRGRVLPYDGSSKPPDDSRAGTADDSSARSSDDAVSEPDISPASLDVDHVYTALSHPRRRYLCYTLHEATEWSLSDLATKVAAWEYGVPERAVTDDQRDRVYVSLYHVHVPKLVDEGVVRFDEATETLTAGPHAEQVLRALDGIGDSLDSEQESHARGVMDDR